nr:hypothetical protein [Mycoplasmopsis bovis]
MNIESMSGRSPKNGKGSVRPKKTKSNDEILDEFLNDLNKEWFDKDNKNNFYRWSKLRR